MLFLNFHTYILSLCLLAHNVFAYFETCDKIYAMSVGVNPPAISSNFSAGASCRYSYMAPARYEIVLSCTINVTSVDSACTKNAFLLERNGDKPLILMRGEKICGSRLIVRVSNFNKIVFGFYSTVAGSIWCQATSRLQTTLDCGWTVNQKIVNGEAAGINEFPPVVGLVDTRLEQVVCGASIINRRWIVSAAHCMDALEPGSIAALVGDNDLSNNSETPFAAIYSIIENITHPDYNDKPLDGNDIILFKTNKDIVYSRGVGPACLPWNFTQTSFVNFSVDIAGWGAEEFSGPPSTVLRKVTLKIVPNSQCAEALSNPIISSQICTFTSGKDTCQYDSGSGLFLRDSRMFLLGVVSYGGACYGSEPSVNTAIAEFLPWIYNNTLGESYAYKTITL